MAARFGSVTQLEGQLMAGIVEVRVKATDYCSVAAYADETAQIGKQSLANSLTCKRQALADDIAGTCPKVHMNAVHTVSST
jgi:hypothetical protein